MARSTPASCQMLAPFALAGWCGCQTALSRSPDRCHGAPEPANATHTSVWRDAATQLANRSSRARLAGWWLEQVSRHGRGQALLPEAVAQKITPTQEASSQITRMIPMITPIRMRPMVSPCVPSRQRTPHAEGSPARTHGTSRLVSPRPRCELDVGPIHARVVPVDLPACRAMLLAAFSSSG